MLLEGISSTFETVLLMTSSSRQMEFTRSSLNLEDERLSCSATSPSCSLAMVIAKLITYMLSLQVLISLICLLRIPSN